MSYFEIENCIMRLLLPSIVSHLPSGELSLMLQAHHQKWHHKHNELALLVHFFV
jgi:hypothetical protein